jgi:hypothetical protein
MMYLHTLDHPFRAETHLPGDRRVWAEATKPHETMADVLRYLAGPLLADGVLPETSVWIKPSGQPRHEPVLLRDLAR